jgi:DHA2 family multidrug resistance protein-like MFS transporter
MAAAAQLPTDIGAALLDAAKVAFVDGLQITALISTVLILATTVVAVFALRSMRPSSEHGEEAEAIPAPVPVEIAPEPEPAPSMD